MTNFKVEFALAALLAILFAVFSVRAEQRAKKAEADLAETKTRLMECRESYK